MARKGTSGDREKSMNDAAENLDMTAQAIGMWATKGAPVAIKGGRRFALWPAFPVWYHQQLRKERAKPADFEEARARKTQAEAELAKYQLAITLREFIAVADLDAKTGPMLDSFPARLLAIPHRLTPHVVACGDMTSARELLQREIGSVLSELTGTTSDEASVCS